MVPVCFLAYARAANCSHQLHTHTHTTMAKYIAMGVTALFAGAEALELTPDNFDAEGECRCRWLASHARSRRCQLQTALDAQSVLCSHSP